jgi:hypothetical protein
MTPIREIWRAAVPVATSVVVIGVAARKHDRHVWDPIQNSRAAVHYITNARSCMNSSCWLGLGASPSAFGLNHLERFLTTHVVMQR